MLNRTISCLLVVFAFFLLPAATAFGSLYADGTNDSTKIHTLRDLIVTEKNASVVNGSVQQMKSESLKQGGYLQVSDVLKNFAGTFIKDYGGVGGLKTVSVRSLGANHTGISYDGIGVSDVNTGQIDLSKFSVENLELVLLAHGQAEGTVQTARNFASASIILLQTKRPVFSEGSSSYGVVGIKSGSFGLFNPTFNLNQKISKAWSASFHLDWLKSEGNYPYQMVYGSNSTDSSTVEFRKNADISQLRTEANWFGTFNDGSRIHIKAYFQTSDRGLPGATVFYASQDFASQRLIDTNWFTQGNYRKEQTDKFNFLLSWKLSNNSSSYFDPDFLNSEGMMEQNTRQQEYYVSGALSYHFTDKLKLSYASDLFANLMQTDNRYHPARLSSLNYLSANYTSSQLKMSAGLLHSFVNENSDISLGLSNAKHFSRLSPYLNIGYSVFKDFSLRAFYKDIFRMPTFSDLYYPLMGNPDLEPENAKMYDLGANYDLQLGEMDLHLSADIYSNLVTNKIVAFPNKSIYSWTILNFGKTKSTGFDWSANFTFPFTASSKLTVGTSYSYQRALDITDTNGPSYLHQLPYTPRVSGSSNAGIAGENWFIQATVLWSGHRYVLPQNFSSNRLEGFTDVHLGAGYTLRIANRNLDLKGEVLNLFDDRYSVVRWFPMPERNYRVSIAVVY